MIDIQKLRRWTNSETANLEEAKTTHYEIRAELEMGGLRGVDKELDFKTLLQGSYRNTTMVYGSGDVDILVIRTDTYHAKFPNTRDLTSEFAPAHNPKQKYEIHKEGVYRTLQHQYGAMNVKIGDVAIEVDTGELPLGADVVPCLQYRKFWNNQPGNHMKGIVFWTEGGKKVVNHPRRHHKEGVDINSRTDGHYKETVRIFKNIRNSLKDEGRIGEDQIPSYYIECLLSNVSEGIISRNDLRDRVEGILDELINDSEREFPEYTVQHGMRDLFGEDEPQWQIGPAQEFVRECERYYYQDET